MKGARRAAAFCWVLLVAWEAAAQDRAHDGKIVAFGNLHAHSRLSDDVRKNLPNMWPADGFAAADAAGLDFLAITDHHQAIDSPRRLALEKREYKEKLYEAAMKYNARRRGEFVAIPGLEWGNTATGNHVNLIGARALPPDTIRDGDYDKLYDWARTHCEFVQFNHPDSWAGQSRRNLRVGNFGIALYADPRAFVNHADPVAKTISVISSVKGGHISGPRRHSKEKTHRETSLKNFGHFLDYLNMGFRLSPAANQDTHGNNWGTVTAARTAVWTDELTYPKLMDAFRANRVYATEDDELAVVFQVRHGNRTYWMGESVPLGPRLIGHVMVRVKLWQLAGTDGDPTDEGPYTVKVWSDRDGAGNGSRASVRSEFRNIAAGTLTAIPLEVVRGEYVFLEVVEEGGKDNPVGDGADEVINETGAAGSDKKRDNLNDTAWTSPIWFVE